MTEFDGFTQEVLQTEFVFGPRVDVERKNAFLPEHPRTLMATGRINSVPFITGVNQNEGALLPSRTVHAIKKNHFNFSFIFFVATVLMADGGKVLRIFEKDPVDFFVKSGTVETLHGFKEMPKADQVRFAKSIFDHYQYDANRTLQERMTLLEQVKSTTGNRHGNLCKHQLKNRQPYRSCRIVCFSNPPRTRSICTPSTALSRSFTISTIIVDKFP